MRTEPARKSHLRWLLYVSGPSMLVITPLLGLPFFSDQRIVVYRQYARYGVNPLDITRQVYLEIDHWISQGNFRPIGRFTQNLEQAAIFDIATATGLPPYIIQGIIRLLMIALLSYAATCFILALYRSAELGIQNTTAPATASDNATPPLSPKPTVTVPHLLRYSHSCSPPA